MHTHKTKIKRLTPQQKTGVIPNNSNDSTRIRHRSEGGKKKKEEEKNEEGKGKRVISGGKEVFFDWEGVDGKWTKWRGKKAESEESGDELSEELKKLKVG